MGQFGFILGHRVSQVGPRDSRFSPTLAIFGAPRRPMSGKLGSLTPPILVDTGRQKGSILVKLEAVGRPILVHFRPPSQPLRAPARPIFANFGHFLGAKTPDFGRTWNANLALLGGHRSAKTGNFGEIGGGRRANVGSFRAAESTTLDPATADFRQLWPFLGPQAAQLRSKFGTLTQRILVDTGAQKQSILQCSQSANAPFV